MKARSPWLAPLRGRPVHAAGAIGLVTVAALAVLGAWYTPYDPAQIDIAGRLAAPSASHWLGTDQFGRDLFSRLLRGAGISMSISLASTSLALAAGLLLGTLAGYFGGAIDRALSTLIDALLSMPGILLALVLASMIGASRFGVIVALAVAYTPNVARVARAQTLLLREALYVEAARLHGQRPHEILLLHVLPNLAGPVTVLASAYFAQALLAESALSFLGLGVPPSAPSWGGILAEARAYLYDAPWMSLFPGLAIATTLLCINLTGDATRDALDPRLRLRLG
jgi:peptide/nickel transport system permease protein